MKTDGPSNDLDREATAPPGGMAIRDKSQPTGAFYFRRVGRGRAALHRSAYCLGSSLNGSRASSENVP